MVDLPPLYTEVQLTQAGTDYGSRDGTDVDSFGIHHAVTTSLQGLIDLTRPGGRTVSPTLAVKDHRRVLIVPLGSKPFTSASSYDSRSWTVEAANETMAPDYLLSDATYESLSIIAAHAYLQEGVPLRHGIPGVYEHKNLYQWFAASYPTACAGPHFDMPRVLRGAEGLLAGGGQKEDEEDDMLKVRIIRNTVTGAIAVLDPFTVDPVPGLGGVEQVKLIAMLNGIPAPYWEDLAPAWYDAALADHKRKVIGLGMTIANSTTGGALTDAQGAIIAGLVADSLAPQFDKVNANLDDQPTSFEITPKG